MRMHCFLRFLMMCVILFSGWQVDAWAEPVGAQTAVPITPAPGSPERKAIMDALRAATGMQVEGEWRTVFVVKYLKVANGWAWTQTLPQSANQKHHYEDVSALLKKKTGHWSVVAIRPSGGDCDEDPDCSEDRRYFKKLREQSPGAPVAIFPVSFTTMEPAGATNINCLTIKEPVEQLICRSSKVQKKLESLYQALLDELVGLERKDLIRQQQAWMRKRCAEYQTQDVEVNQLTELSRERCLLAEYAARTRKLQDELNNTYRIRFFETKDIRVPIPRGWHVTPPVETAYRYTKNPSGRKVIREVVQTIGDWIEISNGRFIMTVATEAKAKHINGGSFNDVARLMAASKLITQNHPDDPYILTEDESISDSLTRIDLYREPTPPMLGGKYVPPLLEKAVWYGSYVATGVKGDSRSEFTVDLKPFLTKPVTLKRLKLRIPRYVAITLSYQTNDIQQLPEKGDEDLEEALGLTSQVAKNICVIPELGAPSSEYCVLTGFDGKEKTRQDGRVTGMGELTRLWEKEGKRYLEIDYTDWITEDECRWQVRAGVRAGPIEECGVDPRLSNRNPLLRTFQVSPEVEIKKDHPMSFEGDFSWHGLIKLSQNNSKSLTPLLWRIVRHGTLVERMEWLYTP